MFASSFHGDASWGRQTRLTSLRDEWRRICLPQPAFGGPKNFWWFALANSVPQLDHTPINKRQHCFFGCNHVRQKQFKWRTSSTVNKEKLEWRTPIRRHSSRSDVSRLGCATQASLQLKTQPRRQKNQSSEDCCNAHICAYRPFNANNSECAPRSTIRPASNTKISCASTTVDKRCAITSVVLFCAALCNSA